MSVPRLVIAGTSSGVGKTTIAVGIMAALRRRGVIVQPFKVGPDYIDPSHHTVVAGRASRNLDSWMVPKPAMLELFGRACHGADVAIVEGVMGLFDGHSGRDESGSTAEVAKLVDAPVVVIINAARMARSAAAVAFGYSRFDPSLRVAGFLLNGIGGERHFEMVKDAIEGSGAGRVFGYLPRDSALDQPERHLGLVPAEEEALSPAYLDRLVELIETHVDVDGLLAWGRGDTETRGHGDAETGGRGDSLPLPLGEDKGEGRPGVGRGPVPRSLAGETPALPAEGPGTGEDARAPCPGPPLFPATPIPQRVVIAVARDEAFNFYYQDNLDLLEAHGARIVFFSPLRDRALPDEAQAVYIGGGFPEMHAPVLAANEAMRASLRKAIDRGMPAYAECGGLMYLSQGIEDENGRRHPMVGVVPGWCSMRGKRLRLGYVEVASLVPTPLGPSGIVTRGHEFHYSLWDGEEPSIAAYTMASHPGRREGFARGNLLASFVHLHFGSNPSLAPALVESGASYGG